jgi:hypothetical protein
VQDALMARLNPQLDIQQSRLQQQLADQGIRYGSDAYNNAYTPFNQQANDARFAAIAQAGQEQQRMQQQLLAQGQFYNAGQQQNYDQALGAGSFANQAQGQLFQQNAAQATFANAGLAQQVAQQQAAFNAAQAARGAYMGEQYAARNQPLNEITALLGGSQVQMPNLTQTNQSQIPTTDIAGLINTNFNQQMQNYQQASTNYNTLTGGALGALGGYLRSDRRVKDVDHKIATVFAADDDGTSHELPIYKYSYKDDPTARKFAGPMAQDVEKINPQHVAEIGGRKFIRPQQVMGSILRAR